MTSVLIHGGRLLHRAGESHEIVDGDVLVRDGTIAEVGGDLSAHKAGVDRVVDARDRLVMPGLANMHTHSYGNLFRGLYDGLPLEAWVPFATATTLGRTRREGWLSAMLGGIEHLTTGTTVVLDHLAGPLDAKLGALDAYRELGLRVALAPMIADLPPHTTVPLDGDRLPPGLDTVGASFTPSIGQIVEELVELLATWHRPEAGTSVLPGPSGPQRCSPELLDACAELAETHHTGIHTHLLETRVQAQMATSDPDGSLVGLLARHGLLTARFSGAHGVWCTDAELERIAEVGATLVHNPWSNLTLGSGVADLPAWRRAGVVGALGTDGANCGGNLSMFRAMSLAAVLTRSTTVDVDAWTSPDDVLTMATEGGARALGLDGRIGRIAAGRLADLVLLDVTTTTYAPTSGLLGQLVHGEMGGAVRTVLVGGRVVVEEGRIPGVDVSALLNEADEAVTRILAGNSALFDAAEAQRPFMLDAVRRHA